jgi:pimeloyl-ACP methyl ester carboxylesterase
MLMRVLTLLFVVAIFGGTHTQAHAAVSPQFKATDCPIEIPADLSGRIRCGTVAVPRDYDQADSGEFELMILIGRADNPQPDAKPIFLDFGGWSMSNVRDGAIETRFRARTRDIVLVDRRGVGFSTPEVCSPGLLLRELGAIAADRSFEGTLAELRTALLDCRAGMAERGIQPEWFGTRITSRDMEHVRQALGYDQILLYGNSQGGRQALDYLAAYPEHVAAAVVDSPSLPDSYLKLPSENFDRALSATFDACEAQPACAARFPDLHGLYRRSIANLDEEGLAIPFANGPDGRFVINGAELELLLQQMLYSPQGIALVPATIEAAAQRRAAMLSPVIELAQSSAASNGEITGMVFECRERPSLHQAFSTDRGADIIGNMSGVCEDWTEPGEVSRIPENASVPVLLLSGRFDPVTPPAYAKAAAEEIGANARHVVFAHLGHGAGLERCVALEMIPAFFDAPDADLVDCEKKIPPIMFATPPQQ